MKSMFLLECYTLNKKSYKQWKACASWLSGTPALSMQYILNMRDFQWPYLRVQVEAGDPTFLTCSNIKVRFPVPVLYKEVRFPVLEMAGIHVQDNSIKRQREHNVKDDCSVSHSTRDRHHAETYQTTFSCCHTKKNQCVRVKMRLLTVFHVSMFSIDMVCFLGF